MPKFFLGRQPSFQCSYIGKNVPVLGSHPVFGRSVRFSQSRVTVDERDNEANAALSRLGKRMIDVREKIPVLPGDLLFVNNRLALHGRDSVPMMANGAGRWLLRTYGYHTDTAARLGAMSSHIQRCP
jgi:L-asparagine oxygenase